MRLSKGWTLAAFCMVCLIWGNSMVSGTGSGSLSLSIVQLVHGALGALGLPYEWVTNFLVRKCAHFSEYLLLGVLVCHAFDVECRWRFPGLLIIAGALAAVPCIDETIQLFVPGRCGAVRDVCIDCAGAATGTFLCWLLGHKPVTFR